MVNGFILLPAALFYMSEKSTVSIVSILSDL